MAIIAETIGDFCIERAFALDGDAVEALADAWWAERFVPIRIDLRGAHGEATAGYAAIAPVAVAALAVEVESVEWDVMSGALACSAEFGAAIYDHVVLNVDVGDVGGVADEVVVAGHWQILVAHGATKIAIFDEAEPQRADAEGHLDTRSPAVAAIGEGFGW